MDQNDQNKLLMFESPLKGPLKTPLCDEDYNWEELLGEEEQTPFFGPGPQNRGPERQDNWDYLTAEDLYFRLQEKNQECEALSKKRDFFLRALKERFNL